MGELQPGGEAVVLDGLWAICPESVASGDMPKGVGTLSVMWDALLCRRLRAGKALVVLDGLWVVFPWLQAGVFFKSIISGSIKMLKM